MQYDCSDSRVKLNLSRSEREYYQGVINWLRSRGVNFILHKTSFEAVDIQGCLQTEVYPNSDPHLTWADVLDIVRYAFIFQLRNESGICVFCGARRKAQYTEVAVCRECIAQMDEDLKRRIGKLRGKSRKEQQEEEKTKKSEARKGDPTIQPDLFTHDAAMPGGLVLLLGDDEDE